MEIDSADESHIAYFDGTRGNLKYVHVTAACVVDDASCEPKTIDVDPDVGDYPSLRLDARDIPRISYFDDTYNRIKLLVYDHPEVVDPPVNVQGNVYTNYGIGLDSTGTYHVAYKALGSQDLYYHLLDGVSSPVKLDGVRESRHQLFG